MKRKLIALTILFALTSAVPAATKQTSFTHDFQAGISFIPTVWYYWVIDYAFFIFNPNSTSINVKATLTAVNNPNFDRFTKPGCVGSCSWNFTISGYSSCLAHSGELGLSGMGLMVEFEPFWTEDFELEVKTYGSSAGKKFYFYGPDDGFIAEGEDPDLDDALTEAWQDYEDFIPVSWDSGLGGWVVPFANYYHNHPDWPLGWRTTVEVTRQWPPTETYTIRNHNQHVNLTYHGHNGTPPATCCSEQGTPSNQCSTNHKFNTICETFSVGGYSTVTKDAYTFHVPTSAVAQNDGQLLIVPASGSPSKSKIRVRVFPNSTSGTCSP